MQAPRRRRWPWLLGAFALLVAIGAFWIDAQLEPRRLATTVLAKAGESLQLKLGFRGTPEYAFRPEPRLVLPGFSAAGLDGEVFLSAKRAEISLPWATITGGEPVITRIELDTPVLQVAGLQRWLASRPPTPFKLPTLRRGLGVSNGSIIAATYNVRSLELELPHLEAGDPAQIEAKGELASGQTVLPFQATALAGTPGLASALELKLTMTPTLGSEAKPTPVSLALSGRYRLTDALFTLEADKLALVASSPLPSLDGKGRIDLGQLLHLRLDAVLARWPEAWPKLPAALAAQSGKLPVHVEYEGKRDFSDVLTLVAKREQTELQASPRLPELQQWLAADAASPLPPLSATLKTPALKFDGIELQGVEVEISDGGSSESAP